MSPAPIGPSTIEAASRWIRSATLATARGVNAALTSPR